MTLAGASLDLAISEHLHWISGTIGGIVWLFAPFAGLALIFSEADRRTGSKIVVVPFAIGAAVLAYTYFNAFHTAQQALLDERWTAAAMTIAFLPFAVGVPLLGVSAIVAMVIVQIDRR